MATALKDEAAIKRFAAATLVASQKTWEDKSYAQVAYLLKYLKPHAKVVVPMLVTRMKELEKIRGKEKDEAIRENIP